MSSDAHTGGNLSDLAVKGTSIPGDAGKQNIIPSVPRPDQKAEEYASKNPLGQSDVQTAADNATDLPRRNQDIGATGEVVTGTGDQLPATVESKRLHFDANEPQAKGHDRYAKHSKQDSGIDRYQGEGAVADAVPDEEGDSQDAIRDRKGI